MQSSAKRVVALAFLGVAIASSASPVIVREGVNAFLITGDGTKAPLPINSIVEPGTFIGTDANGRVQLEIGNSLVRFGVQSSLALTKESHITLKGGAFLFKDIPPTDVVTCRRGNEEVRISGDMGFVSLEGTSETPIIYVGGLGGKVTVQTGSTKRHLNPAEMLVGTGSGFRKNHFDLSKMIKTSRLINGLTAPWTRNETLVAAEREFAGLQRRGFVRSPKADEMGLGIVPVGLTIIAHGHGPGLQNGVSGESASASSFSQSFASTSIGIREGIEVDLAIIGLRDIGLVARPNNGLGPDKTPNGNAPPTNPSGDPHTNPPGNSGNAPGHHK
jgi:hypothetical protein